jgi:hypothetical protein
MLVCLFLFVLGQLATAMTVTVDPANANGTTIFATPAQAAKYIRANNDVGVADAINVVADTVAADDVLTNSAIIDWYDDVTIDGDADGNGTWCTLVVSDNNTTSNSEYAYFRLQATVARAWGANFVLKNFTIIPKFKTANSVTDATKLKCFFSGALGSNLATSGSITLENLVITGSLTGDVAANPFVDDRLNATNWNRGLHMGSKLVNAMQTDTKLTVRNVILSYCANESVQLYMDNTDATFGPGFIIMNTKASNAFSLINSAYNNRLSFAGTPDNRNLFYGIGDAYTDRAINNEAVSTSPTWGTELSLKYTDFVNNNARQEIRNAGGPLYTVDNCLFAEIKYGGSGTIEGLNSQSAGSNLTISNCTFYNIGPDPSASPATPRFLRDAQNSLVIMEDVIFAAGPNEAATTSSTTEAAFDYAASDTRVNHVLFPEVGPYRLRPAYDTEFPPSPATDAAYINPYQPTGGVTFTACQNVNPMFAGDNVTSYPLPTSVAAWRTKKITLADCQYLLPTNPTLEGAAANSANLHGVYSVYTTIIPNKSKHWQMFN